MTDEKPLLQNKSLVILYEEITCEPSNPEDPRKAKRFFRSLGVLRRINGHPAVFRSEVFEAMKSDKTKK